MHCQHLMILFAFAISYEYKNTRQTEAIYFKNSLESKHSITSFNQSHNKITETYQQQSH